ncbi:MAG TPA: ABC transporter permease [Bryobacteraceae bacterium]
MRKSKRAANLGIGTSIQEEIYRMNTVTWLDDFWQDLRHAARTLRQSPGFACVAVLSLALGTGANTAIFQLLDAVRLRSLPVRDPQSLVEVRVVGGVRGMGLNDGLYGQLTRPIFNELKKESRGLAGLFAWSPDEAHVGRGSNMRRVQALYVTGDFFPTLGVTARQGRLLLPEDESACPATRAVVSYSYWQNEMGGGQLDGAAGLVVNGDFLQVVGVAPPGFAGLAVGERFDVAVPFCRPKELRRDVFDMTVMGRLRPGQTLVGASAELGALSAGIMEATALTGYNAKAIETYKGFRLAAYPASSSVSWLRKEYNNSLWLLLAITGMVLLIACANLANLMLARASVRQHEISIRLALGASRFRLIRQLLTESALIAAAGAALGVLLAQALSRLVVWSVSTTTTSVYLLTSLDWRVLLFTAAVCVLTCAFFGIVPAVRATCAKPVAAMKSGGRNMTAGRESFSLQRVMVIAQIAVCLVLLAGAALFIRSFRNLMTFDPGMREAGITVAYIGFEPLRIAPEHYEDFKRRLVEEVSTAPGIRHAAITSNVPLTRASWTHGIHVDAQEGSSKFTWVSPSYFDTMNIHLMAGRNFKATDTADSPRVAIVNQTFVRRYLRNENPIGRTLRTLAEPNYPATSYEIVGVIPDTKYADVREKIPPMTFAPAAQLPAREPWTALMIYSNLTPSAVKNILVRNHPEMVVDCVDFQTRIRDGFARERLMAVLSGLFGLLAAVLAMLGLYGIISYLAARRRNEVGIRLALGAERQQVMRLFLRDAARFVIIGLAIGTLVSLIAMRGAASLLFGLKSYDPFTLALAGALLAGVAVVASFLPAYRAAKLDPMIALRDE